MPKEKTTNTNENKYKKISYRLQNTPGDTYTLTQNTHLCKQIIEP